MKCLKKYYHDFVGMNNRLSEIQPTVPRVKLRHLDEWNDKRRAVPALYNELLQGTNIIVPVEKEYAKHVYHLYVIRCKNRDELQQYLLESGAQTQIHYSVSVHKQKAYLDLGYNAHSPVTEKVCSEVLSLLMHPFISNSDLLCIDRVIKNAIS